MTPYPWQTELWRQVAARRAEGRLPHGLLLTGPAGLGKRHFADCLARALLCDTPLDSGLACGYCRSCELAQAGSHPDQLLVEPQAPAKQIVVDQIRQLGEFQFLTRKHAQHKVITIAPAEAMNVNAANSLLKSLEEPAAGTIMLLICERIAQLPATVRSRCQRLTFAVPPTEQVRPWLAQQLSDPGQADLLLALSQGLPLLAQQLGQGEVLAQRSASFAQWLGVRRGQIAPLEAAAEFLKRDLSQLFGWCLGWTADLIRLRAAGPSASLQNPDLRSALQDLVNQLDLPQLFEIHDRLKSALRMVPTSINDQLLVEDLLLAWAQQARK